MRFISLQCAFFFKKNINIQAAELSIEIKKTIPIFNIPPLIIPLPPNAPPEVPRLQLKSQDHTHQLNVAENRADFFYTAETEKQIQDFKNHRSNFSHNIKASFELFEKLEEIKRLGYVAIFFKETDNAINDLSNSFIVKGKIKSPKELNIRFNTEIQKDNFILNDITAFDPGEITNPPTTTSGIFITRDINTDPLKSYDFTLDKFNKFIQNAEKDFSFAEIERLFY